MSIFCQACLSFLHLMYRYTPASRGNGALGVRALAESIFLVTISSVATYLAHLT